MSKHTWPFLGIISSLVCILVVVRSLLHSQLPTSEGSAHPQIQSGGPNRADNIDSLVKVIKQDKIYHVTKVYYHAQDSSLRIEILGEKFMTYSDTGLAIRKGHPVSEYFDTAYSLIKFKMIDRWEVENEYNFCLFDYSKKGQLLENKFRSRWVTTNGFLPFIDSLRAIHCCDDFDARHLYIHFAHDSVFYVQYWYFKNHKSSNVAIWHCRAHVDFSGKITDFWYGRAHV